MTTQCARCGAHPHVIWYDTGEPLCSACHEAQRVGAVEEQVREARHRLALAQHDLDKLLRSRPTPDEEELSRLVCDANLTGEEQ